MACPPIYREAACPRDLESDRTQLQKHISLDLKHFFGSHFIFLYKISYTMCVRVALLFLRDGVTGHESRLWVSLLGLLAPISQYNQCAKFKILSVFLIGKHKHVFIYKILTGLSWVETWYFWNWSHWGYTFCKISSQHLWTTLVGGCLFFSGCPEHEIIT